MKINTALFMFMFFLTGTAMAQDISATQKRNEIDLELEGGDIKLDKYRAKIGFDQAVKSNNGVDEQFSINLGTKALISPDKNDGYSSRGTMIDLGLKGKVNLKEGVAHSLDLDGKVYTVYSFQKQFKTIPKSDQELIQKLKKLREYEKTLDDIVAGYSYDHEVLAIGTADSWSDISKQRLDFNKFIDDDFIKNGSESFRKKFQGQRWSSDRLKILEEATASFKKMKSEEIQEEIAKLEIFVKANATKTYNTKAIADVNFLTVGGIWRDLSDSLVVDKGLGVSAVNGSFQIEGHLVNSPVSVGLCGNLDVIRLMMGKSIRVEKEQKVWVESGGSICGYMKVGPIKFINESRLKVDTNAGESIIFAGSDSGILAINDSLFVGHKFDYVRSGDTEVENNHFLGVSMDVAKFLTTDR